jgi:RimJ/RimL family protein N-acetyltransferase
MLHNIPTTPLHEHSPVVLETTRLTLRRPTLADVKAIAMIANDRRIAENTRRLPHPYGIADAEDFITSIAQANHESVFLIELEDRRPIGMVGLDRSVPEAPEIGYWLGVDYWKQGYGTEAARAVIDHAFEELDAERLVAGARVTNPGSRRILEKCGFQWTGVVLQRMLALGSSTPVDCFRLERHVWQSLKNWGPTTRRVA